MTEDGRRIGRAGMYEFSVEEIDEFCGWDFIEKLIRIVGNEEVRKFIILAFKTGGRSVEVLNLKPDYFKIKGKSIVGKYPVAKSYEKVREVTKWRCIGHCKMRWDSPPDKETAERYGHVVEEYRGWETKPRTRWRSFSFLLDEPLSDEFLQFLDNISVEAKYPTIYKYLRSAGELMGEKITPHWLRGQRACQLVADYDFREMELMEWFEWKDYSTALRYAKLGYRKLEEKMLAKRG